MSSSLGKAGRHERTEGFPFPGLATISQFTFIGELLFPFWLLIKGVNVPRWEQLTHA